jgi:hypothetical protein
MWLIVQSSTRSVETSWGPPSVLRKRFEKAAIRRNITNLVQHHLRSHSCNLEVERDWRPVGWLKRSRNILQYGENNNKNKNRWLRHRGTTRCTAGCLPSIPRKLSLFSTLMSWGVRLKFSRMISEDDRDEASIKSGPRSIWKSLRRLAGIKACATRSPHWC